MEKYFKQFLKDNKENFQLSRIGNIFYHACREGFDRQDYKLLMKIFSDINIDTAPARENIFIDILPQILEDISYNIGSTEITFERLFDFIFETQNLGLTDKEVKNIVLQMNNKLNYTLDDNVIKLKE